MIGYVLYLDLIFIFATAAFQKNILPAFLLLLIFGASSCLQARVLFNFLTTDCSWPSGPVWLFRAFQASFSSTSRCLGTGFLEGPPEPN